MTHFGLLQHDALTGGFLDTINPNPDVIGLFGTRTKTGTATRQATKSQNFISSKLTFDNILKGTLPTPQAPFNIATNRNLIQLGLDTTALGQSTIDRFAETERNKEDITGLKSFVNEINDRLSGQVTDLGDSLGDQGGDPLGDFIQGLKDNPLLAGLGTGALIAGGVVLFLVLRR